MFVLFVSSRFCDVLWSRITSGLTRLKPHLVRTFSIFQLAKSTVHAFLPRNSSCHSWNAIDKTWNAHEMIWNVVCQIIGRTRPQQATLRETGGGMTSHKWPNTSLAFHSRRKFKSLTSDSMDSWKTEQRSRVRRKKIKLRKSQKKDDTPAQKC